MTGTRVGVVAGATAAILFGSSFVATAYQLRSFDPVAGAFWRGALAAALLLLFTAATWRRARGPMTPRIHRPVSRLWRAGVIGVLGGPMFLVGVNVAVEEIGASVTAFVAGSYAIGAALLAPLLLREPLTRGVLAAFVVALVGTALLAEFDPVPSSGRGLLAAVLAALAYSLYLVLGRRWSVAFELTPRTLGLATVLATVVVLPGWHAVSSAGDLWPAAPRGDALLALGWLGVTLAGGQVLVIIAARRLDARRLAALLLLNPLSAFALATLVLGERLSFGRLVGATLLVVGMALAALAKSPTGGSVSAPEPALDAAADRPLTPEKTIDYVQKSKILIFDVSPETEESR